PYLLLSLTDPAPTELYTLSLHDALPIFALLRRPASEGAAGLIQQQLIELRARFDQLVAAQHEVPKALAQGSAEQARVLQDVRERDRKSTRLNSSHVSISYAVFCLKKKNK